MQLFHKKSVIVGHRIWWTVDWFNATQTIARNGLFFGVMASIMYDEFTNSGIFASPNAQLVGIAALWVFLPSCMTYSRGILVRHEQGPRINLEESF